jgi:hypothetical protein
MHQVHSSRVNPLTPASITKEIGQGKEYLQKSSITTTHMGFNALIVPNYHLSHGGNLTANPDPLITSPTNHHIT